MSITTYTGTVTTTGEGRNGGQLRSSDGLLEHRLAIPAELGGAGGDTNPEQLFAAGWSACFMGALRQAATREKVKLSSIEVTADVTLNTDGSDFWLTAELAVVAGGTDQQTVQWLAELAHTICPYSKAITGNVPVRINARVADQAA
ncbi:Ohr family peroxiredoxin [Nocardioides sp. CER19]|uniref:Ohr family peroxiredoxin n=1 Tax=Nocardioides sp. CER19 TaxID=3038538 RepID=UPI002448829C|nr:Ohr family peroxiredoxin [Nocardioides sp. CER19]MDH2414390.1 Ohr family peroxiredoxin [Nocardioides sp. CER19]